MQRKQQSNSAIGIRVVALETSTRRLAIDFPGWEDPNHVDHLLEIPIGLRGQIVNVEQHGSNPWTRYAVTFEDGTRGYGLIMGRDIKIA